MPHHRNLLLQMLHIVDSETHLHARLGAACLQRSPSGKTPIICMPKLEKIAVIARPNPAPYASRITTVAMPQAIPSIVSAVRRRLCLIDEYACPSKSWTICLFPSQRFHRLQQ